MCGQIRLPQYAHHHDGGVKHQGFQGEGNRNGDAQRPHFPQTLHTPLPGIVEQVVASEARIAQYHPAQTCEHEDAGQGGGQTCACQSHGGHAQIAKDQEPAQHGIDTDRGDGHRQSPSRLFHGGQEGAQHDVTQIGQQSPLQGVHIGHRARRDNGVLAHHQQDMLGIPQHNPGRQGNQ